MHGISQTPGSFACSIPSWFSLHQIHTWFRLFIHTFSLMCHWRTICILAKHYVLYLNTAFRYKLRFRFKWWASIWNELSSHIQSRKSCFVSPSWVPSFWHHMTSLVMLLTEVLLLLLLSLLLLQLKYSCTTNYDKLLQYAENRQSSSKVLCPCSVCKAVVSNMWSTQPLAQGTGIICFMVKNARWFPSTDRLFVQCLWYT